MAALSTPRDGADSARCGGRWAACVALAAVCSTALISTAAASDRRVARAVLLTQLELLGQQTDLNNCLEKSQTKNTPCIRREARQLVAMAVRHISAIDRAIDGTERRCALKVARQEIAFLRFWRDGALALAHDARKRAKRLFVASFKVERAQNKVQPQCFADILSQGP